MSRHFVALLLCLAIAGYGSAAPIELITNGDFETGTFAGWAVTDAGSGSIFIDTPGTTTPLSGFPTAPNAGGGSFFAVSDQFGPGTHALTQSFTVPGPAASVILTFDMFVNDQSGVGPIVHPSGLDHTSGGTFSPNQHARVDILTAGAGAFDTGGGVVASLFLGVDPGPNPHAYTPYLFDITPFVGGGGTFQIRFAEVDNQSFFHQGVDNVSILFEIPEPTSLAIFGMLTVGAAGFYGWRRRKKTAL